MDLTKSVRSFWDDLVVLNDKEDKRSSKTVKSYDEELGLEVSVVDIATKSSPRRNFFQTNRRRSKFTVSTETGEKVQASPTTTRSESISPRRPSGYVQRSRDGEKSSEDELLRLEGFTSARSPDLTDGDVNKKSKSAVDGVMVRTETPVNLGDSITMCGYYDCDRSDCLEPSNSNQENSIEEGQHEAGSIVEGQLPEHEPEPERAAQVVPTTLSSSPTQGRTANNSNNKKKVAKKRQHFRLWGHGKLWTSLALVFAWLGCICAVISRQSVRFVDLKNPLEFAPAFEPVGAMGVIRMEICYNETLSNNSGCKFVRLSRDEVNDKIFNTSRSLLTLGTALGIFLTVVLSTSVYWETINLRPIGFGFLFAYLFQSFSLIFLDTDLCHEYKCKIASGGILCIVASICWIATCAAVAKMDNFKILSIRALRRAERKKAKQLRKEKRLAQKAATSNNGADDVSSSETTAPVFDTEQGSIRTAAVRVEGKTMVA